MKILLAAIAGCAILALECACMAEAFFIGPYYPYLAIGNKIKERSLVLLRHHPQQGGLFNDPLDENKGHQPFIQSDESVFAGGHFPLPFTATRRALFFQHASAMALMGLSTINFASETAFAYWDKQTIDRVLVLGGTGFVGSRIVELLRAQGIPVVGTSTDGREGTVAFNALLAKNDKQLAERVQTLSQGCTAVISCIGAIGGTEDETINGATAAAAQGAKAANVQRFVYITVAPEVMEFARDIEFLEGYMRGKAKSRAAILDCFPQSAVLIEPTFIYGGGSFELNPPRVASFYGKFIEGLLSSSPLRTVERVLSPGIVKIALEPPVAVEDVAAAAVAGALGQLTTTTTIILDSYDKIKQAAAASPTTTAVAEASAQE